jgi:hypothetical protein
MLFLTEIMMFFYQIEEIPSIMREIGRQRELTFRAIGEGTNFLLIWMSTIIIIIIFFFGIMQIKIGWSLQNG